MLNPYPLLNEFSPEEAVQAITGIVQPKTPEEKNTVSLIMSRIRADIDSGKLPATITEIPGILQERIGMRRVSLDDTRDHRPIVEHHYTTTVIRITRPDLLAWCKQTGIRPPLLFPDEPPIPSRTKGALYALLAGLCVLQYGKIPPIEKLIADLERKGYEFDKTFLTDTLDKAKNKLS